MLFRTQELVGPTLPKIPFVFKPNVLCTQLTKVQRREFLKITQPVNDRTRARTRTTEYDLVIQQKFLEC